MPTVLDGGCLCGAVRYAIEAEAALVDWCHCSACRRSTGGMAVAWAQVAPAAFRLSRGRAGAFASSATGVRHFCPDCGSQLFMTDSAGRSVGITLATLDEPQPLRPAAHGFDGARPDWLCIADDLPRFPAAPPYDGD